MLHLLAQIDLEKSIVLGCDAAGNCKTVGEKYKSLSDLVNLVVTNLFVFAGIFLLFLLILGGLSIIASDSSKGVEEGKKKITSAIIGFLVMFSAYWIIQIVEFITGVTIIG